MSYVRWQFPFIIVTMQSRNRKQHFWARWTLDQKWDREPKIAIVINTLIMIKSIFVNIRPRSLIFCHWTCPFYVGKMWLIKTRTEAEKCIHNKTETTDPFRIRIYVYVFNKFRFKNWFPLTSVNAVDSVYYVTTKHILHLILRFRSFLLLLHHLE